MGSGASTSDVGRVTDCSESVGSFGSATTAGSASSLALRSRKALSEKVRRIVSKPWTSSLYSLLHRSQSSGGRIRAVSSFSELYMLGPQVAPPTHQGMEVRHGRRKSDMERVVIKIRSKKLSFASAADLREWRASTEMMLSLPKTSCLAQLHEVLEDSRRFFIVMEYVEGEDLFEALDCNGSLPISECRKVIQQLLQAVEELHARGCIHKDLKLENVMVTHLSEAKAPDSTLRPTSPDSAISQALSVKLVDFDTVVQYGGCHPKYGQSILGTDQYISQEAYAGIFSPASDMFAVGVIAYKIITGHFPFDQGMFDDKMGENYVGCAKMKEIQDRVKQYHIDWTRHPFPTNSEASDFCKRLLSPNAEERPLAADALRHEWLTSSRHAKTDAECCTSDVESLKETHNMLGIASPTAHDEFPLMDDELELQSLF